MAAQLGGQPVLILREGTRRTRGREAQNNNIMAAKAVAAAVRTTLGPKGMDKMLVDSTGDVVITNDGVTILREMDIEHPAAKMVVEVAKTQDDEVGDGTTTAAVLVGELLGGAQDLLEQNVHPTLIAEGYRLAALKANEILRSIANHVSPEDEDMLRKIAETAMTGKGAEASKEKLSKLAVKAAKAVAAEEGGKKVVDIDNIKIEKRVGASTEDAELIEGIVVAKERVHPNMPKKIEKARIALITTPIEFSKMEVDAEISITSPDQLQSFLDQEEKIVKEKVEKIISTKANVIFCEKGIDDLAQYYLARAKVMAAQHVDRKDMDKLVLAIGASLVTNIDDIEEKDLGNADLVEEKKIGENLIFVTGCSNPKAVTLLIRGGTEHVVESTEKALEDALRVVGVTIEDGTLLAGGGSPEVELALRLREYAATLKGREQLAANKFAEALEVIPKTLAESAGLDPIDKLIELRSHHEKGERNSGLNVYNGEVADMWELGVVEPLRIKTQAIGSATEAATMILRIDDVLAASEPEKEEEAPGEPCGPGAPCGMGMGRMPPMM